MTYLHLLAAIAMFVAFTPVPARAAAQVPTRPPACLLLAFGRWSPEEPDWLPAPWRHQPPPVQLLAQPIEQSDDPGRRGWLAVAPAPTLGADTVWRLPTPGPDPRVEWRIARIAMMWRPGSPDSVVLMTPAALDNGFQVRGRWRGDTLLGRAYSNSDVFAPEADPRANAYGVRYDCTRAAEAAARRKLARLSGADVVDEAQNRREIERARRWADSLIQQ